MRAGALVDVDGVVFARVGLRRREGPCRPRSRRARRAHRLGRPRPVGIEPQVRGAAAHAVRCRRRDAPARRRADPRRRGSRNSRRSRGSVAREAAATFGLGETAPDAVRLADTEREVEAVVAHLALRADRLRTRFAQLPLVASFAERRREEQHRLRAAARCTQMPRLVNDAQRHHVRTPSARPMAAERIRPARR